MRHLIRLTFVLLLFSGFRLSGQALTNAGTEGPLSPPPCSVGPDSILAGATTLCSGDSVALTQSGGMLIAGGVFYWYADSCDGAPIDSGAMITVVPLDTTTYFVRAEDSCGVTACASITIDVLKDSVYINGLTAFCQGVFGILTAVATQPSTYMWSNGATSQSIAVNAAGTYTVTATDSTGCSASDSTVVTVYPKPLPVIGGNPDFCVGDTAVLDAGTYFTYIWSTGETTQTISTVTPGIYTVTVTDTNGCSGSDTVTVAMHPKPTAVLSGTQTICAGHPANLVIDFTGIPPFTYAISDGTSIVSGTAGTTPAIIQVSPYASTTYTLAGATDAICTADDSGQAVITVLPQPQVTVMPAGPVTMCFGDTALLTASADTGLTYQWYRNGVSLAGYTGFTYTATASGEYQFGVTDSNGCDSLSAGVLVTITCVAGPPPPPSPLRMTAPASESFELVPNPARDEVAIVARQGFRRIRLMDASGREVGVPAIPESENRIILDLHALSPGHYFVEVTMDCGRSVARLLKE